MKTRILLLAWTLALLLPPAAIAAEAAKVDHPYLMWTRKDLRSLRAKIETEADEAYFLPQAEAIRAAAPGVPIMLVGGVRSLEKMDAVLASGTADYFSMSRPLIREPHLPARWQKGDRRRADCISCLGCFGPARKGEGIRCVQAEKA